MPFALARIAVARSDVNNGRPTARQSVAAGSLKVGKGCSAHIHNWTESARARYRP